MQLINWQADVFELKQMFSSLGVKINATISAGSTVAQRKKTPQAAAQPMHLPV
jgi:nitrogenase molybdenum-iron protein alpha/beta subunit